MLGPISLRLSQAVLDDWLKSDIIIGSKITLPLSKNSATLTLNFKLEAPSAVQVIPLLEMNKSPFELGALPKTSPTLADTVDVIVKF